MSDYYPPSQDQPSQYGYQPPQYGPASGQPRQGYWPPQGQGTPNAAYPPAQGQQQGYWPPQGQGTPNAAYPPVPGQQQGYWPPQGQGTPNIAYPSGPQVGTNGMGITGFVLGLLGILLVWIPFISVIGVVSAILGIIFSAVGLRRAQNGNKGLAVAGLVLSIIATALSLCVVLFFASLIASMSS